MALNSVRTPTILIIGASRGLGLALAAEFLNRGWSVVGTVQGGARTALHDLADKHPRRIEVESLNIMESDQIAALHDRLSGRSFEMLFHNAGIANADAHQPVAEVSTEAFIQVMATNALGPMRVIEGLQDLVGVDGLIGIMSSGQGSISNNEKGGAELYRGSKAALNQFMRCYAARHAGEPRSLILMAPGWIRTAMGGPDAPYSVDEAIPKVVDVLLSQQGKPGLRYLDREGRTVPW